MATQFSSSTPFGPAAVPAPSHNPLRPLYANLSISARTGILLTLNLALLLAVCMLFFAVRSASNAAETALSVRSVQVEVANEFGRTSDQLTRVARGYAVTGDPAYRGYYDSILGIRDGTEPRPRPYRRTYWNLVIAGAPLNHQGRTVSIRQLAREAAFDEVEMRLLDRAVVANDALTVLEHEAMSLPLGQGQAMMFSDPHSRAKAAVMRPLDELLERVEDAPEARIMAAQGRAERLETWLVLALLADAALIAATAWRFVFRVIRPLIRLSAVMDANAQAPDSQPIPYMQRPDEIGRIARALEAFRAAAAERDRLREAEHRTARRRDEEAAAHQQALSAASARTKRLQAREALVQGLSDDLSAAMAAIGDASGELAECAQTMTLVAHGTERRLEEAEAGGRDTAAHVDTVAATCRQLARATGEIEDQANRSIASTDRAVDAVRRTGETVDALMGHSESIQGIVALIGRIATKTNRLAINATIEAAHAGEAGRGFAIVAAEVKSLARQTASAADEISDQLGQVRHGARQTATMVEAIAASIADARDIGLAIGGAVEQQAQATGDISLSADLAARRTRDCVDTMATIRSGAAHTQTAIGRVMGAASALTGTNDAVRQVVDRFAGDVRET